MIKVYITSVSNSDYGLGNKDEQDEKWLSEYLSNIQENNPELRIISHTAHVRGESVIYTFLFEDNEE
jgi:hypothetical protein